MLREVVRKGDDFQSRIPRGGDAVCRIFEGKRILRADSKSSDRLQIQVRKWLCARNVICADDGFKVVPQPEPAEMRVDPPVLTAAGHRERNYSVGLGDELDNARSRDALINDVEATAVGPPLDLGDAGQLWHRFLQEIDGSFGDLLGTTPNRPKEVLLWKRSTMRLKLRSPSLNFGGLGIKNQSIEVEYESGERHGKKVPALSLNT